MGTAIMLLCIAGLLTVWDFELKALQTISRPLARRHLDWRVPRMAHRLLVLARYYGGLTVDLDRKLVTSVPAPTVVCANHQSVGDIVVLLDALHGHRVRFVAKKELSRGFPAVSEVLRIQRHALINRRGDYREVAQQLHRLGHETRFGVSPVVFPEGTRSRDGVVRQFHPGGARIILSRTNVPITAVAVDGGYRFVSVADTIKGLSLITYRARLVGVFHHDGTKQGITDAVQDAQRAISDQIDRWRATENATRGTS